MASRAIPSHLKPSAAEGKGEGGFNSQRHHGKSQSHVSNQELYRPSPPSPTFPVPARTCNCTFAAVSASLDTSCAVQHHAS
ncbi:hypothetical protein BDU57DRAFT_516870 [Ampelomyces quisqualis]|uniref:Uncharacterized protein n=1 Tax=Ampelomyces quisqualis TaxID=50730 RepID=A0A6A5QP47_AMPQU|nr:hypothetical protein BDU57DRAFT_516870 [Ampelomyces quisqualis]